MLQINIKHNEDTTVKVESIQDFKDGAIELLAIFDENEEKIDLNVCKPYIGQEIEVHHRFNDVTKNYNITALLDEVEYDSKTHIKSISYLPRN